jgi:anti-sigma factor RsiW
MRCEDVSEALPEIVDGAATADLALRRHVDSCLRCQAELAQYRKLLRAMHHLRTEVLEPAPGLLADILAKVEEASERRALRSLLTKRHVAYAGAIAATAAAGAAGAVLFVGRRRLRAA